MLEPVSGFPGVSEQTLRCLAAKYIWWKTPDEALLTPTRVVAQVMDIGEWEDVLRLIDEAGEDALRSVLRQAEAGQFRPRSWHYWHYRLGLARLGEVPPLPVRRFE